jgi:hypothetical protein
MRPEPLRLRRRSSASWLIRGLIAIAILSLALIPAWSFRHLSLDGLASGETLSAPKLMLSAVHL